MNELHELLARVLEIDSKDITDETSPMNVESWDSFNGLMIVSELESHYKVKFSMDEIVSVQNVGDIKAALKRHNVKLS